MSVDAAPRKPKTFRLPRDLVAALEKASVLRDRPQTEIVEDALRRALGAAEEGPAAGPSGGAPPSPAVSGREGDEPSMGESRAANDAAHQAADSAPASPQPRDTVGLAGWLSGRVEKPHALCRHFIEQGRVQVGGVVCKDAVVSQERLMGGVTLDGEPV